MEPALIRHGICVCILKGQRNDWAGAMLSRHPWCYGEAHGAPVRQ